MGPNIRVLAILCLELAGLAALASLAILIAAFHRFEGFGEIAAGEALVFCVVALAIATAGLIAYACVRFGRLMVANRHLFRAATRDPLTRLLNRGAFKEEAEKLIAGIGRRRGDPTDYTLLIVDADHFKRINDRLGHGVGDRALVAIATALAGGVRHDDLVGRLGGEEFCVLLRGAGPSEARIVAERLRLLVHRLTVGAGAAQVRLSVSLGGFSFDRPVPFDLAYRQADLNLYRAKNTGRNRSELSDLSTSLRQSRTGRRVEGWAAPDARRRAAG